MKYKDTVYAKGFAIILNNEGEFEVVEADDLSDVFEKRRRRLLRDMNKAKELKSKDK